MNHIINQIRGELKAFVEGYGKGLQQIRINKERFVPATAKAENDKILDALRAAGEASKSEIKARCEKGLQASLASDHLRGESVTSDAALLKEPFKLTQEQFTELVEKYRGNNFTMLTLMREYAKDHKLDFPDIPTPDDKRDAWKQVERGAVELIDQVSSNLIYDDHVMLATEVVSVSPLAIATGTAGAKQMLDVEKNPIFQRYVLMAADFMNSPLSDRLNAILEA